MADSRLGIPPETWLAIETDYIQGKGSRAELAAKYGIPDSTVKNRASQFRWMGKRKTYLENQANNAVCTQPGLVPPMNPPDNHQVARHQTEDPEYWLNQHRNYTKGGLDLLDKLEAKVSASIDLLPENAESDVLVALTRAADTILDRRRIILGIPLVAPIKRVEKNVKRGSSIVPIDTYESLNQESPMLDGDSQMDGLRNTVQETENLQVVSQGSSQQDSSGPKAEVENRAP